MPFHGKHCLIDGFISFLPKHFINCVSQIREGMTYHTAGGTNSQLDWCRIYGGRCGFRSHFLWVFRSLLPSIVPPMLYSYSYVIMGLENGAIRSGSNMLLVLPRRTNMEIVQWREHCWLFARNMIVFRIHIARYSYTAGWIITQGSIYYIITKYLICVFEWFTKALHLYFYFIFMAVTVLHTGKGELNKISP
jgi:hypothetical protein